MTSDALIPGGEAGGYPMTSWQAGMVSEGELWGGGGGYHSLLTVTVGGALDAAALAAAVQGAAARHPALRTGFDVAGPGGPRQVVAAGVRVPLVVEDLSGLGRELARGRLSAWRLRERACRFDAASPPLLRVFAHRLPDGAFALTLSFHSAILDGHSAAVLAEEILRDCAASAAGGAVGAGEGAARGAGAGGAGGGAGAAGAVARAYEGIAAAERAAVADPQTAVFWRSVLAGPVTALPRLPGFPVAGAGGCERLRWEIGPDTGAGLARAAAGLRVPLRVVLLAGYLRALGLASGEAEVVTGIVTGHGTGAPGPVLGMFAATVPVRASMRHSSWAGLIAEVSAAEGAALGRRACPLAEIQRVTGAAPPFTVVFDCRPDPCGRLAAAVPGVLGCELTEETSVPVMAAFTGRAGGPGLALALTYHRAQFPAAQIGRLGEYCLTALASIAAGAGADPRPSARYLAGDAALIAGWNATGREYPPGTLPALVAAQARAAPGAPAVWADGSWLSYGEFASGVNRLARHLTARGVAAGDVVGVCLERDAGLVTAVHAVLAAGAAYLPLDPDYPRQRLGLMASDAAARHVITTTTLASRLTTGPATPAQHGAAPAHQAARPALVLLDAEAAAIAAQPAGPLPAGVAPGALAYVMYTSGSTGMPKGVGMSHEAIVNRLRWGQETFPIGPGDLVMQKEPFSFDVSVPELFWPLMYGAGLVVPEPGGHLDPGYLVRLAAEHGVTDIHFVPSMLEALLGEPDLAARLTALRRVYCSGEALTPALAERFHKALPHAELHNLYGPTEAAVEVTWHPCRPGEDPLPIGAPIASTQLRITDPLGGQAPVGVPGELCIAGRQVARGYLGRPGLTAEKFTADPFGPPGSRMYRTGDRARWLPGGEIEYLGRLDHQVQLHGVRIELGEVEAALASCPGVRACAVTLAGGPGGGYLAAYTVPEDPAQPSQGGRIRRHLAALIPPHMIPARYVTLAELPLTRNGKLDRRALPRPAARE